MKVCLISNQIAAWGKMGGFGTATRAIGRGLARRGVEVCAVVPRRRGQRPVEELDGITVYGVSPWRTLLSGRIFAELGADLYHSQEPNIATVLARRAAPRARHVVTCRDPRGFADHLLELRHGSWQRRWRAPLTLYYEAGPWIRAGVRRADAVACSSPELAAKVERLYRLAAPPLFLPSPVDVPAEPRKSSVPCALFVGRWDRRKRVERFFALARELPEVRFVAVGAAHERRLDRRLRRLAEDTPNLELTGVLDRFDGSLAARYAEAWILVNTAARESLPYTFLEAAAAGCAVLSLTDPTGFVARFGHHAAGGDLAGGLRALLAGERWRLLGGAARAEVGRVYSEESSMARHLELYRRLLGQPAPGAGTA